MKKVSYNDILGTFRKYNAEHGNEYGYPKKDLPELSAIIVYAQHNFTKPYSEKERSYRITNNSGKIFFSNMLGNSVYGDCLDGKDLRVRLDAYPWDIEYCYFEQ